ncbi:4Fe-4S binding protein [Deltaproteobacteria bacterium OttesenSCG-928-M10]|nr:4Fe-4S binding protein [Deltaproteobacteria bacterium OttesenSCG-928-M10]
MTASPSKAEITAVKGQGFLRNRGSGLFSGRILTINGRLTAGQVIGLSEAAQKFGSGQVSFTTRLNIEIPGIPYESIPAFREHLALYGLVTGGTGARVRPVLSCKGGVCQNGLFDTFSLAEEIHHRFVEGCRDLALPGKFKIGLGGCPNKCAKPDLNDFGVEGQMKPALLRDACRQCKECQAQSACPSDAVTLFEGMPVVDDGRCLKCGVCVRACKFEALAGRFSYTVYLGGRWGRLAAPGRPLSRDFTGQEDVLNMLEKVVRFFADNGRQGERISGTIDRMGFEAVEKILAA